MIKRKEKLRLCDCCGTTPHPMHWKIETSIKVHGRLVEPGTVLSIKRERGRFTFIRQVTNILTRAVWIDCIGGTDLEHPKYAVKMFRAFDLQTVSRVHRTLKARV